MPSAPPPGLWTPLLAALATLPPAAAFAAILLFTRRRPRLSAGLSLAAVSVSAAASVALLVSLRHLATPLVYNVRWLSSGPLTLPFGFLLDPLSLLMLVLVVLICWLVQVYSLGYMAGDPGFGRYYAFMSLFAWAMLTLTLSSGLLQLYIFWELVGLSSYLLIGFWYDKFSAATAGKKAFVMTRLGDVAFFLGLMLILLQAGNLDIPALNRAATADHLGPAAVTAASLLIFGGIVGKSAQFPLLTWLPDAMEGPTPVSALLHSATMVAAGVYLFARLFPFLGRSAAAGAVFIAVGAVSMLAAATMATVSRDIKRVWAFSTISQLGYMIMALAAGGYAAGVFHLTTHAGFKALLFLCAGVFIHRYGTNDTAELGRRGARRMKTAAATMLIGGAALAGIPPLGGFFSKELVLETLAARANPVWLLAALAGVFLTAYYTFRLIFTLLRPPRTAAAGQEWRAATHAESGGDAAMKIPLVVLAAATVVGGFFFGPLENWLTAGLPAAPQAAGHPWLAPLSVGLAFAGIGLAWHEFGRRAAARRGFVERVPALARFFEERWYLDRFYRFLLDAVVYRGLSALSTACDRKVIDAGLDAFGRATATAGDRLSALHRAMIQYRLLAILAVLALLGAWVAFRPT